MYTLILMTAMSTSPAAAEFNGFFRNLFNRDSSSCSGSRESQSTGCTGSTSCHGSDTGFGHRIRAFFNGAGSCYGSGTSQSSGCSGKPSSCCGSSGSGYAKASCNGTAYSCNGTPSTLPNWDYGPPTGAGGYAPPSPATSFAPPPGYGCSGYALGTPTPLDYGFPGTTFPGMPYGSPMPYGSTPATPTPAEPPAIIPEDRNARKQVLPTPTYPTSGSMTRATVIVRLPVDALLFAEGKPLTLNGPDRTFVSPPLPGDREFTYTFRAEYVRSGETIARSKKVQVKAGGIATVEFAEPGQTTSTSTAVPLVPAPVKIETPKPTVPVASPRLTANAPERARITVKLPVGATLFVDGKKNDRTGLVREFTTPPLTAGQEFSYLMKAEVQRNGQPESQSTKVTFRAGELVTVDFTAIPK